MNNNENTGIRNTGYCNTGNMNTGNMNTGNRNTGDWNTGNRNTGDRNTGDWNTGDWNTGDWNTGDWNTGYCNTITPNECFIFNKKGSRSEWEIADKPAWIYSNLTKWIKEEDMSDKEKKANPSYTKTGGFLKYYSSLQHSWIEAWENSSEEDKKKTFKLPNFDLEVFKEIFGFDPTPKEIKTITIDGIDVEISKDIYNEIKSKLK